jgi:glyoxylase-like metal-dependent hydrolase (beta-lactamase superfamily II)
MAIQSHSKRSNAPGRIAAPNVICVPFSIVNAYLVGAGDGSWVLVDAGLAYSAPKIKRVAAYYFGRKTKPTAILLTHGHFDHVGALKKLAASWDVPVYAHGFELPFLTGHADYPPPDPTVGGGLLALMSWLFPHRAINLGSRVRSLPTDGTVPGLPEWRWLHTPGHSDGHVSFFRESDCTLIAGDAFVTTQQESLLAVLTQRQQVSRPPAYFTPDWQAARQSVRELAALDPSVAATGHGIPMRGLEMLRQLHILARDFDRVAVPKHGRYPQHPAHGIPVMAHRGA